MHREFLDTREIEVSATRRLIFLDRIKHDANGTVELGTNGVNVSSSVSIHGASDAPAPKTVLVVDDDADLRDAFAETLRDAGYQVQLASDGKEALAALEPAPDLILLDLFMPEMDGWAFMAERRKHGAAAAIPVVVITAHGESMLSRAPVAAGYLTKPPGRERLLGTIERCLLHRHKPDPGGGHDAGDTRSAA